MAFNINNLIPSWLKKKNDEQEASIKNDAPLGFSSAATGPTPSADKYQESIKPKNISDSLGSFLDRGKQYLKDEQVQSVKTAKQVKSGEVPKATLQSEFSNVREKLSPFFSSIKEKATPVIGDIKNLVSNVVEKVKQSDQKQLEYWRIRLEEGDSEKAKEYKSKIQEDSREKLVENIRKLQSPEKRYDNKLSAIDKVIDVIERPKQLAPFIAGVEEAKVFTPLLMAANRLNNETATAEDVKLLQEYVDKSSMDKTFGYNVLDIISMMPSFAGELYMTAGVATAGRTATMKVAKETLEKLLTKNGKKLLEKKAVKFGLKTTAELGARTLQTPVAGGTRILSSTLQKQLSTSLDGEKEDLWLSATKAFGSQWIETVSEFTGGAIKPLSKYVKNKALGTALFSAFKKTNPLAKADDLARIVNRMGYNGVIGEMFEERVADVGHGILYELGLGDQKFSIPSGQQLLTELSAFSVPGAAVTAINKLDPTLSKAKKALDNINVGLNIEDVSDKEDNIINTSDGKIDGERLRLLKQEAEVYPSAEQFIESMQGSDLIDSQLTDIYSLIQNEKPIIEKETKEKEPLKFDDGLGLNLDEKELKKAGIGVEAMGFDESADVMTINGEPAIGYSFLNGNLAGFSVAEKFRKKGIATNFIKDLLKENNGVIKVEDANENMLAVLNKVGNVSKPDGAGTVTVTEFKQEYIVEKTDIKLEGLKPEEIQEGTEVVFHNIKGGKTIGLKDKVYTIKGSFGEGKKTKIELIDDKGKSLWTTANGIELAPKEAPMKPQEAISEVIEPKVDKVSTKVEPLEIEARKYKTAINIKNIKQLDKGQDENRFEAVIGKSGYLEWTVSDDKKYIFLEGINVGNEKGSGIGIGAIKSLFNKYPEANTIEAFASTPEASSFFKKIGALQDNEKLIDVTKPNNIIIKKSNLQDIWNKANKATTQKEKVKEVVAEEPKSIKEVSEITGILEPNVRRILGVGAKDGTFTRVDDGVYVLTKDGKDIAYIETGNALEALPRLAKQGFKADMIFLDIPYKTPAVTGGNRGVKYNTISVDEFNKVLESVEQIARNDNTPIIYMYSQAKSGLKAMQKYTDQFLGYNYKPVSKGGYTKLQKDGVTRVRNMRGNIIEPEGIILFNKTGEFDLDGNDLNFKFIRPRGYQTEKSAEMLKEIVEMTTKEGDVVLDPFAGSGVTAEQAVATGRKAVAIEQSPEAVEKYIKPKIAEAVKKTKDIPVDEEVKKELRKAKGLSISDILKKYPNINLKRDVPVKDIHGDKSIIDKGESLTPYELKGNKVLLQDGETYIVSKNQYQNLRGNAVVAEAKEFAPELKETLETIKGAENIVTSFQMDDEGTYNELPDNVKKILDKYSSEKGDYEKNDKMIKELEKIGWTADYNLEGEITELSRSFTKSDIESVKTDDYGQGSWIVKFKGNKDTVDFPLSKADDKAEAIDYAINEMSGDTTKYANYQLPRGKKYKEILIQAPERKDLANIPYSKATDEQKSNFYGFKSSHWDESNVLAHVRLNERDYKGNKVTFVEEIQSDWAREGRDKGFIKDTTGWTAKQNTSEALSKNLWFVKDEKGVKVADMVAPDAKTAINGAAKGVPSNPLLKNWQELSIKRALQDAVNNNSAYFAWINGEQTSARYNLSTQVDGIEWYKSKGNKGKLINITPKSGTDFNIVVDDNGTLIEAGRTGWEGKKLNEVLGKGLADKIMEDESGNLSGEGLKFGGEWAANLYDKQIKSIVEKVTGGKVENIDMGLPIDKSENSFKIIKDSAINKKTPPIFSDFEDDLTLDNIKVGKTIGVISAGEIADSPKIYIITDVIGDGKFKAIPKDTFKRRQIAGQENIDPRAELTFDISTKKTIQQGIKLTPEIKAKISSEAPQIKKPSGKEPAKIIEAIKKRPKAISVEKITKAIKERPGKVKITRPPSLRKLGVKPTVAAKITTLKSGEKISETKEDVALKKKLRLEARAARLGYKKGSRETREKIVEKLKKTQTEIKNIKKQIIDYAKENLPVSEQGRLINTVTRATNQHNLINAFIKIDNIVDQVTSKKLTSEIKKTLEKITNSKLIAVDYKQKINDIMSGIEIPGHTIKTLDKLQKTKDYIENQKKLGIDVAMPTKVLDALKVLERKPWKKLSLLEKEILLDKLELLEELGRTKWSSLVNIYNNEKENKKNELINNTFSIESHPLIRENIEGLTTGQKFNNVFPKILNQAQRIDLSLLPMDPAFDMLDGSVGYIGSNYKIYKATLDSDFGGYLELKDKYADKLWNLAFKLNLKKKNFRRIGVYAALQQKNGREKLIQNNKFSPEEIDEVVLTKDEMGFYNTARRNMEALRPLIEQYMRVVWNKPFKAEENYWPMHSEFDADLLDGAPIEERFGDASVNFLKDAMKTKKTEMGFTKERRGVGKRKMKINAMEVYQTHMDNVIYMLTMGRNIKMLSEIAKTKEYENVAGDFGTKMVRDWMGLMATKGGKLGAQQIKILDILRKNAGVAILGFKLSSIAIQPTAIFDGMAFIGNYAPRAVYDLHTGPNSKEWKEFLIENFPEYKGRSFDDPSFTELSEAEALAKIQEIAFRPLKKLDKMTAAPIVMGAYRKYLDDNNIPMDFDKPNNDAIEYAQLILRRSQASAFFKDLPMAVSMGSLTGNVSLDKAILQFQTFMLGRWSWVRHDLLRHDLKIPDIVGGAKYATKEREYKKATQKLMALIMATLASVGIRRGIKKIIDFITGSESPVESWTTDMIQETLTNIPFLSQIISMSIYDGGMFPVGDISKTVIKEGYASITGEGKKQSTKLRHWIKFMTALGATGGIPGMIQLRQILTGMTYQMKNGSSNYGSTSDIDKAMKALDSSFSSSDIDNAMKALDDIFE